MTDAEKLLEVAYSYVGVTEDPIGSNRTIFGEMYGVNGVEWCMQFVWGVFNTAKLSKYFYNGQKVASCTKLMTWAVNNGYMVYGNYRMGDVFLYDYDGKPSVSEHTGIYTGKLENGCYVAIEGNYNNRVAVVKRRPSEIIGAFRPAWSEEPQKELTTARAQLIRYGGVGYSVSAMQTLLVLSGFSLPRYGADGEYGSETEKALKAFQSSHGLDADGVCGHDTWSALLGV